MSIFYCAKCHKNIDEDKEAEHLEEYHQEDDDYMDYINNEVNQMNNR